MSVKERNELRNHARNNPTLSQNDLQAWLRRTLDKEVGRSTIGKILSRPMEVALNPDQQKRREPSYPEMEARLYDFVLAHEHEAVLSDELLQLTANTFLAESDCDKQVSLSWVQKFKWRHGIKRRKLHGEAASVDAALLSEHRRELQDLIGQYSPQDVFNFDETGLFFRMLPSQTLATKNMSGKKKDKTRISIGLCCNMDGSYKDDVVVINKSMNPRCFKGQDISKIAMYFYANQKAWMTTTVFSDWLKNFNLRMCGRSVLLLIDNASSHVAFQLSNVRVHFLPPNTTSHLQPLDAGIVKSFKAHYRRSFLKWTLAMLQTQTKVKHLDLLSCITFVVDAWKQVSPTTIRNCWTHTGIVVAPTVAALKQMNDPKRQNLISELDELIKKLSLDDPMSAESYLSLQSESEPEEVITDVCSDVDISDDDENESAVPNHREALEAATRLSLYASMHDLDQRSLKVLSQFAQSAIARGMKQRTIDSFFSSIG